MKAANLIRLMGGMFVLSVALSSCSSKSKDVVSNEPAMTPSTRAAAEAPKPKLVADNSANLGAASSGNAR